VHTQPVIALGLRGPSQLSASPCGGVLGFGIQDGNLLWAKRARRRTSSARGAALTRLMAAWQARKIPPRAIFYSKMAVNVWQKMRTDLHKLDREIRESFFEDGDREPLAGGG
jgi:hypothetical protein